MKADATQQRALLELAQLDAELTRIAHRAANLPEQQRCDELEAQQRVVADRVSVLGLALEDLEGQVQRLESEIDGVRQREDRDRALLDSPDTNAKQLAELQHELETLQRRQSALEDSELEIMERREQLQTEQAGELQSIETLTGELNAATHARNEALAGIEQARDTATVRRTELVSVAGPDLAALYDRAGAGALQAGRCGACRIEIEKLGAPIGKQDQFAAAFGGLSLALLAYNLSLWAVLRHAFQLSYSAMVCALMGYTFTSSGIATLAFPALDNNDRQRLSYLFLGLAAIAGVRFMADFFGPRVIGPRLRLVAAVACAATLTSALGFALLAPWQGYWLDRAYFISCGATLLALIPVLISAWRARVRNLGLFILAWSAPIGVSLARAAYGIGLIGFSFWLDNGNLLALSLEGLLSTMLIVARLRDLSNERDRARAGEQTALRLANTDPLTGLLNRRAFIELAIGRPVVHRLLLLDIDHFKLINDQLGHDAGDDVLRAVAQVLQALRPHGSLAVRLGGEEFALLVPLPQVPDCLPESLLDAIRAKPMPHDWKVTASLGHADGVVTTEEDWKRLYRLADTALYRAKADGRDRSCRATNFGAARVA